MEMKKEADFKKYCALCKDKDTKETDDPCNECLQTPAREGTRKPIYFKEK